MIYRVVLDDLYDLHTSDINCMLLNPSLELEMNSAGSFNFTLPPTHPYWDSIEILKSTIDVYEADRAGSMCGNEKERNHLPAAARRVVGVHVGLVGLPQADEVGYTASYCFRRS